MRVLQPETKEYLGLPEVGRAKEDPTLRGFKERMALQTPCICTSSLRAVREYIFLI